MINTLEVHAYHIVCEVGIILEIVFSISFLYQHVFRLIKNMVKNYLNKT